MMNCKYVIDADEMTVSDAYMLILYAAAHDTENALGTFVIDMFQKDRENVRHVPYQPPFCNDGTCYGAVLFFDENSVEIINNENCISITFYCETGVLFRYVILPGTIDRLFEDREV